MDPSVAAQIIALIVLLILSAFFSSAETAFVSVNLIRMRSLAEDGSKRAKKVLKIASDSPKMLSAILIGNNIVNISASSLATTISLAIWGKASVSIATGILTFIVLIFGEISPKTIATTYADKIAPAYSGIIWALMVVLTPVIFIINKISKGVLFIFGFDPNKHKVSITEDELRTIVDVSREEGIIENDEHEMISNVFDFGDSQAKDVMIPRIDMTCISADSTYDEIISVFREYKYTRLPVYEESVDNVIGIVNVKDLLLCEKNDGFSVKEILRKPYYTYEFKNISELMEELRKTSNNFTVVVDEYGSTVGMITLEDLLEEIVGDIRDEYDEDEEDDIVHLGENEYLLSGSVRLDDISDILKLPEADEACDDYDSAGGLIIKHLERLPQNGDEVDFEDFRLVVEECDKNRIIKIHAYITPKESDSSEQ
ncbi:MAG: HlyC/CorC family transporter [Butyrivibrio sp.]|nr:HlyC/CorC family transporter [Butyrivibrio sp.]